MNPYALRVVLRPRTPMEVVDLAAAWVRAEAWPLLGLVSVLVLPVFGVACLQLAVGQPIVAVVTCVLVAPTLQLATTWFVGQRLFDPDYGVGELWGEIGRLMRASLALWSVMIGGVASSVFLLFLPLPGMMAIGIFLPETLVLEGHRVGSATVRATSMVGDVLGRAVVGVIVLVAVGAWVVVGTELAGDAMLASVLQLGRPFGSAWNGDVTPWVLLGWLVAQPVVSLVRLLLYLDVRMVADGWDLQVALRRAAEGS